MRGGKWRLCPVGRPSAPLRDGGGRPWPFRGYRHLPAPPRSGVARREAYAGLPRRDVTEPLSRLHLDTWTTWSAAAEERKSSGTPGVSACIAWRHPLPLDQLPSQLLRKACSPAHQSRCPSNHSTRAHRSRFQRCPEKTARIKTRPSWSGFYSALGFDPSGFALAKQPRVRRSAAKFWKSLFLPERVSGGAQRYPSPHK